MQNKWHLTFLERFSKKNSTSGVIWVEMVDFDDWHLFLTVRANRIEGEFPRYDWEVGAMRTQFA